MLYWEKKKIVENKWSIYRGLYNLLPRPEHFKGERGTINNYVRTIDISWDCPW